MIVGTLTALAAAPNGEALISESSAYFDTIKAKFPEFYEKNNFEEWIRYPISEGLIERSADHVNITDWAANF
jgi:hypothetical protein